MEYCVLIPKELSLSNNDKYMNHAADNFSTIENNSPLVVVANTKILKGTKFRALEGTMRYGQVSHFLINLSFLILNISPNVN